MVNDGGEVVVSTWGFRVPIVEVLGGGIAPKHLWTTRREPKVEIGEDGGHE